MNTRPNILLILNDDMGFSDLGCYGGEIETPHLDRLAENGLRYTQFYNTARCCPSRASLLTGLHPHQADVGHMMNDDDIDGYLGDLNANTVTLAEALGCGGYRCYMSGKWHVTRHIRDAQHNWPCQRGFHDFYGTLNGCGNFFNPGTLIRNNNPIQAEGDSYYTTDAFTDETIRQLREHHENHSEKPFFQYLAYTAPHWPLHAHPEDIEKYKGRFDEGWDVLREKRLERLKQSGILPEACDLSDRDETVPPWADAPDKAWQARRMEVYAAQLDRMDQGIGRVLQTLEELDQLDNTLILFLSDNGGCAEELLTDNAFWARKADEEAIATATTRTGDPVQFGNAPDLLPGGENTYASYGTEWANLSNTPFRLYKHWVHEGGIATPFIVHWPAGIDTPGKLRTQPAQLPDIMATLLDLAQTDYPETYNDHPVQPCEGFSMVPTFGNQPFDRDILCWEHEGNRAVRKGNWKLVSKYPGEWELYNLETSRSETQNCAAEHPDRVAELTAYYTEWAERCHVRPWDELLELRKG